MSKTVVIDSRYFGKSGLGQANKHFLDYAPKGYEITIIGSESVLKPLYPNFKIINDCSNPFSKKGLFFSKDAAKAIKEADAFLSPAYMLPFNTKNKNTATIIHDCVFFDVPDICNGKLDLLIRKFFYRRALRKSKWVFTVSNFSKERIQAIFGYDNAIALKNGLPSDIIEYKKKEHAVEKKPYFIYVGNLKAHKGLDVLIDAFNLYKKSGGKSSLYIVGNDEGMKSYVKLKTNDEDVIIKKNVSDPELFSLVEEAQALIQPSRYEGFGLTPLEALYLGTPVIINDIPVFHEVYDTTSAVFFKHSSAEDLATKLADDLPSAKLPDGFLDKYNAEKLVSTVFDKIKEI